MARWFPLIRRIVTGGGGGAGFIASVVQVGIQATNRFVLIATEAVPAILVDATRNSLRISKSPAVASSLLGVDGSTTVDTLPAVTSSSSLTDLGLVSSPSPALESAQSLRSHAGTTVVPTPATSLNGVAGTAVQQEADPALSLTARIADYVDGQEPAANVVQITYDLTRVAGGDVATNVTGSWTNLTNAQGTPDGATATSAGGLGAGTRKMRLGYANSANKGELTITSVVLRFYMAVTGDATSLLSDVTLTYDIGAGEVLLETFAGNAANLVTPRTHDITTAIGGSWANIDALAAFVEHVYAAASIGVSCAVDAVTVTILANATQTV